MYYKKIYTVLSLGTQHPVSSTFREQITKLLFYEPLYLHTYKQKTVKIPKALLRSMLSKNYLTYQNMNANAKYHILVISYFLYSFLCSIFLSLQLISWSLQFIKRIQFWTKQVRSIALAKTYMPLIGRQCGNNRFSRCRSGWRLRLLDWKLLYGCGDVCASSKCRINFNDERKNVFQKSCGQNNKT